MNIRGNMSMKIGTVFSSDLNLKIIIILLSEEEGNSLQRIKRHRL